MDTKYFDCKFEMKQDSITDTGIFEGFASDYIDRKDDYGDIIVKGAFTETLRKGGRNGNGIAMLWHHNSDEPIGVYQEVVEKGDKLRVVGELALGVQKADEAYILAKMGAIKGLSIGWDLLREEDGSPVKDAYELDKDKNIRYLKQLELWEISLVTFPANRRATIISVKGAIEGARSIREFEKALREEGMSNQAAKYLASLCKPQLEKNWNKVSYNILKEVENIRKKIK